MIKSPTITTGLAMLRAVALIYQARPNVIKLVTPVIYESL
jgi:hypothetical protein